MKKKPSLAPIKTRLAKTADLKAFDLSKDEIRFLYKDGGADASTILEYAALADLLRRVPGWRVEGVFDIPLALLNPADYHESADDIPEDQDEGEDEYLTLQPPPVNLVEEMAERFDLPGLHLLKDIVENYINGEEPDFDYNDWQADVYSAAFQKAADDCKCAYAAGIIPPPFKKEKACSGGARLKAKRERTEKLAKAQAKAAKA